MNRRISRKGEITLPAELRRRDGIVAGQVFEITRIDRGEYQLKRVDRSRNEGLVDWLLACPLKGWFVPYECNETTDSVGVNFDE